MNPIIESNKEQLRALALRYGVGRLSVFGSMARNDANAASDVDLLLENSEGLTGFQLGADPNCFVIPDLIRDPWFAGEGMDPHRVRGERWGA